MKTKLSVRRVLIASLIGLVLALVLRTFVIEAYMVVGGSMNPTYDTGDRVVVLKCFYTLQRGDVVLLDSPKSDNMLIKRVIGLPGEDMVVFPNGWVGIKKPNQPISDFCLFDMLLEAYAIRGEGSSPYKFMRIKIPDGHYWVMGDNRPNSSDSRAFGSVPQDYILGKVVFSL